MEVVPTRGGSQQGFTKTLLSRHIYCWEWLVLLMKLESRLGLNRTELIWRQFEASKIDSGGCLSKYHGLSASRATADNPCNTSLANATGGLLAIA
jgi:hypothetical protein